MELRIKSGFYCTPMGAILEPCCSALLQCSVWMEQGGGHGGIGPDKGTFMRGYGDSESDRVQRLAGHRPAEPIIRVVGSTC